MILLCPRTGSRYHYRMWKRDIAAWWVQMEEFLRKWGWQLLWCVTLAFLLPGILRLDFISMGVATAMVLYKGYNFRSLSNPQKTSWVLSLIYIGVGLFFILVAAFVFGNYAGPAGGLVVFASFLGSVVALFPSAIIHWLKTWPETKISSLIPLITAVVTITSCVILPPYIYGGYRNIGLHPVICPIRLRLNMS